ncbi:hypothetical protein COF68_31785 [Bacillus toyonensis]|uniref:hypothetical protein n=1 Tax=Bacillus toyonensis TaxID=155322 RepID=UPI000BF6F1E0|nr:hypothetical protein [Bacillus toyonensis]PGE88398.1 hypothetical protein COM75_22835 [Bacillus toyonensis]PHE57037.1 hypothetical protein COF68_31785 [Bacillus toyonensis]
MSNYEALIQRIESQDQKIKTLQNEILTLKDHITRLSICKLTDSRYPLQNFIVDARITAEQKSNLDLLFLIISDIFKRKDLTPQHLKAIESLGVASIFSNGEILYNEVIKHLMRILDAPTEDLPLEMLEKMNEEGSCVELCQYLLSQAKK